MKTLDTLCKVCNQVMKRCRLKKFVPILLIFAATALFVGIVSDLGDKNASQCAVIMCSGDKKFVFNPDGTYICVSSSQGKVCSFGFWHKSGKGRIAVFDKRSPFDSEILARLDKKNCLRLNE